MVSFDYSAGNSNVSFLLYDPDSGGVGGNSAVNDAELDIGDRVINFITMASKEETNTTRRPYLNITYTDISQNYTVNITQSIGINTGRSYQEDANATSCSGTWHATFSCDLASDGDWDTFGGPEV